MVPSRKDTICESPPKACKAWLLVCIALQLGHPDTARIERDVHHSEVSL